MFFKKYFCTLSLISLTFGLGCASSPSKPVVSETPPTVVTPIASQTDIYNTVDIEFKRGSQFLTENAKSSLKAFIEQSKYSPNFKRLILLSWSDEEYPSQNLKKLPKTQSILADERNMVIESFVKTLRPLEVDRYNMAEQPGVIAKWFNTKDNKLKSSLLAAGLPTTADATQFAKKAGHSILVIRVD